jgi:hypothetical protein
MEQETPSRVRVRTPALPYALIHRSASKGLSANVALTAFSVFACPQDSPHERPDPLS